MKEKMLVTEALDERDLLAKKIRSAVSKTTFVTTRKKNSSTVLGSHKESVETYNKSTKSAFQSITDMIDRYNRLDAAILLSNATEKIEVGDCTMTRAAAINLRKSFKSTSGNFDAMLLRKITNDIEEALIDISSSEKKANEQCNAMIQAVSEREKAGGEDDAMKSAREFCNTLVHEMVDPLEIVELRDKKTAELEELQTKLESAIKVSNATTFVEF